MLSEEDSLPFQILLTSNSAADIANIKEALGHYHAFVSASGDEAMEILKADPKINLLILDLKASGAFRLLEALKTDDCLKKLRTVILTDSEDPESESKGLQLGAIDFFTEADFAGSAQSENQGPPVLAQSGKGFGGRKLLAP